LVIGKKGAAGRNFFSCTWSLKKTKKAKKKKKRRKNKNKKRNPEKEMSDARTYLGITHNEIRKIGNTIAKNIDGSLDDELKPSELYNREPAAANTTKASDVIWRSMEPKSMYYVYKNNKDVYYVLDFGVAISKSTNGGAVIKAIYEHKPPPVMYTKETNFNEYFMLSTGVSSSRDATGTLVLVMPLLSGSFAAVYQQQDRTQKLYSASTDVFTSSVTPDPTSTPIPSPIPSPITTTTQIPLPLPVITVPSPTTLATAPCTGPYASAINKYNTDVMKAPTTGTPIACVASEATDAATKLTVTITDGTTTTVTFKDVAMEKKGDVWVGFVLIAATAAASTRWIRVDVAKDKKLSYTACLGQCDLTAPKYKQVKDLVVTSADKDQKYTFEGGTVEYSGQDPFSDGGLSGAAIAGIAIGVVLFVILIVVGLYVLFRGQPIPRFVTSARNKWDSWRGRSQTGSESLIEDGASQGNSYTDTDTFYTNNNSSY
jgi:hypothetical protein